MIPVPAAWLQAASGTHRPEWRAAILTAAGDTVIDGLPVTGGQITRDEDDESRTRANVDVPTDAVPRLLDQAYLPTGGRLRLQYRIHPDPQWATVADLDMVASAISRPEDVWTIAAADRAARIAMDDLARGAIPTFGGDTYANTIRAIVHRTFPGDTVTATGPATTLTVPAKYGGGFVDGDPWALVQILAAEAESEVFYSHDRACTVRPAPDIGTPVDSLGVGDGGVLTGYTLNHQMGYNDVAVAWVNDTSGNLMVRGTWIDNRADSPVSVQRIGSRVTWGKVLRTDDAPTQAQADGAAAAFARKYAGRAREAELRHPTRPWLEPGDSVSVTFLGGPTETQVVRSVAIDLGPANIQVTRLRNHQYTMGVPVL